ncbi:hypothetical protein GCM10007094_38070 [Pseudovibrio japonicus]|uniref:DUF4386 domain-containing protein n=1 Tax=Pseudovibrio japonicus TaxID=366534 RepID=A0ABQ3EU23_9HYPH|nr:hypothetical protein [Pseudovibrio japonicus]GHB45074.1 hypothetical protein GCM10007094_38070 [Pseudovibrio japonicus]
MGNPEALQQFDLSVAGFWRSFYAQLVALALGLASLLIFIPFSADGSILQLGEFLGGQPSEVLYRLAIYVVVLIWPALNCVVFAYTTGCLSDRLGIRDTYSNYIIVRNWATVVLACFTILFELLMRLSGSALLEQVLAYLPAFLGLWVYFRVARLVALATIPVSFGLLALEFVVDLALVLIPTYLIFTPVFVISMLAGWVF